MNTILIADDDRDILEILTLMLQTRGYTVVTASTSADILQAAAGKPNLVLLDLWMSGTDGREIFTRLRQQENTKDIPVVFMSANSRLKEIAGEYGVDDFIEKPFDMNFMLNKIQHVLQRKNK